MKRSCAALLAALMLCALAPLVGAQTQMTVYVADGALKKDKAEQLIRLLERALPEAAFSLLMEEETETSLRALVMADSAPQIAICPAEEAACWGQEGLLLPLEGCVTEKEAIAGAVLAACTQGDSLFMAPLDAQHRRMAVNRRMLERAQLGHLFDFDTYPVWLPMQMYQVLEEFMLSGDAAMEIWPARPEESAAILALMQAVYNGVFLSEDGQTCLADTGAAVSGAHWLQEMVDCEMIGMAASRQQALERFLAGETAVFLDWTEAEAEAYKSQAAALGIMAVPYPSSSGLPVHAFDVIGVSAFKGADAQADALAQAAVQLLMGDAQVQRVLGERAIWEDNAIWLPCLGVNRQGMLLRSALCEAVEAMLCRGVDAQTALRAAASAAEAAGAH